MSKTVTCECGMRPRAVDLERHMLNAAHRSTMSFKRMCARDHVTIAEFSVVLRRAIPELIFHVANKSAHVRDGVYFSDTVPLWSRVIAAQIGASTYVREQVIRACARDTELRSEVITHIEMHRAIGGERFVDPDVARYLADVVDRHAPQLSMADFKNGTPLPENF